MKKFFLSLITILFLVSILFLLKNYKIMPKNAVKENKTQPVFSEIDEKRQACLDTGEGMSYCTLDAIDEYENEIDKLLKEFKKVFSQSQYDELIKTQQLWREFYEQNTNLLEQTIGNLDGTMYYLIWQEQRYTTIKNRAKDLKSLYDLHVSYQKEGLYDFDD